MKLPKIEFTIYNNIQWTLFKMWDQIKTKFLEIKLFICNNIQWTSLKTWDQIKMTSLFSLIFTCEANKHPLLLWNNIYTKTRWRYYVKLWFKNWPYLQPMTNGLRETYNFLFKNQQLKKIGPNLGINML
jgi:hypothetical protein